MNPHTQHFPVRKERASRSIEHRRDRGANSKRLPCIEAASVAFDVPIAERMPAVHKTSKPTCDGEGVPTVALCGQLPGCLPAGYDLDSMLTREEFCIWQRVKKSWLRPRLCRLPGVVRYSRKNIRIHVRTYLDKAVKGVR